MSTESKDLIKRMLTVHPNDRLGSFGLGDQGIRNHKFFDGMDWDALNAKKMKVPFVPKVSDPLDGSNFDDYSKLEAKAKNKKLALCPNFLSSRVALFFSPRPVEPPSVGRRTTEPGSSTPTTPAPARPTTSSSTSCTTPPARITRATSGRRRRWKCPGMSTMKRGTSSRTF